MSNKILKIEKNKNHCQITFRYNIFQILIKYCILVTFKRIYIILRLNPILQENTLNATSKMLMEVAENWKKKILKLSIRLLNLSKNILLLLNESNIISREFIK